MNYGYARCSTNESKQDINRQVRELKAAGAEEIFIEYEHGDSKINPLCSIRQLPVIPSSFWKCPDWHEAHSNFVKSLSVCGRSVCGS